MFHLIFLNVLFLAFIETSRIIVCVPCPSVSHQVMFYPLVTELVNRGHEVVFITTNPMHPKGEAPANLTEIDTHDVSYKAWKKRVLSSSTTEGNKDDGYRQAFTTISLVDKSFEMQMMTNEVQDLIKNKTHFDLLIIEGVSKSALALSHVFKAPMIVMNSLGGLQSNYHIMGASIYPKLLYPVFWHQKLNNMSILDKIKVMWDSYKIENFLHDFTVEQNLVVKRLFGPDLPSLEELGNNACMLFLNIYPIWEHNRPVPPGVIFIGGLHQKPQKELPKDLKAYLDSSENGVVYFSFGTNIKPSTLSEEKIRLIIIALAELKYNVLVKWDSEELPGKGNNTKVAKWLPQSDLLRHPNIKAFITQGGLQSFDEAMTAGVPLVGIPMLGDQWFNVERFVSLKIGIGLLMEDLTENLLVNAVNTVIDDPSYRRNIIELREKIRDQPESALDRAVWWTEHVIRHKGATHLRAPAANMSWAQFLDLQLWITIAFLALSALAVVAIAIYLMIKFVGRILSASLKFKKA